MKKYITTICIVTFFTQISYGMSDLFDDKFKKNVIKELKEARSLGPSCSKNLPPKIKIITHDFCIPMCGLAACIIGIYKSDLLTISAAFPSLAYSIYMCSNQSRLYLDEIEDDLILDRKKQAYVGKKLIQIAKHNIDPFSDWESCWKKRQDYKKPIKKLLSQVAFLQELKRSANPDNICYYHENETIFTSFRGALSKKTNPAIKYLKSRFGEENAKGLLKSYKEEQQAFLNKELQF